MAKLLEYRELALADLLIDKGQVRTRNVDKEVALSVQDLAERRGGNASVFVVLTGPNGPTEGPANVD